MLPSSRAWRRAGAVLVLALGASLVQAKPRETAPRPPEGGLIIGVSINSVRASYNFPMYATAQLIRAEDAAEKNPGMVPSKRVLGQVGGTAVYFWRLPPGKYRIDRLSAVYSQGNMIVTEWIPFGDRFGEVTIESGKLTDGGTILVQSLGKQFLATRVPSFAGQRAYAMQSLGRDLAGLDAEAVVAWEGYPDDARKLIALIERNAPLTGAFLHTRDDRVLVPGKFGQLYRYEGEGRWNGRATGLAGDLVSVNQARNGDLLVGGEFGAIARASGMFSEWTVEQLPVGHGAVLGIVEAPNGELVALAAYGSQALTGWKLFVAPGGSALSTPAGFRVLRQSGGQWQVMRELPLPAGEMATGFADGNDLVARVGKRKLARWSGETEAWTEFETPVDDIERMPDGTLSGLTAGGFFSNIDAFMSRDGGKTWAEVPRGSSKNSSRVSPQNPVVPLQSNLLLVQGHNPGKGYKSTGTYVSADGGANWKIDETASGVCTSAHRVVAQGDRVWVLCTLFQVYGRDGLDQEWKAQREFTPVD